MAMESPAIFGWVYSCTRTHTLSHHSYRNNTLMPRRQGPDRDFGYLPTPDTKDGTLAAVEASVESSGP